MHRAKEKKSEGMSDEKFDRIILVCRAQDEEEKKNDRKKAHDNVFVRCVCVCVCMRLMVLKWMVANRRGLCCRRRRPNRKTHFIYKRACVYVSVCVRVLVQLFILVLIQHQK